MLTNDIVRFERLGPDDILGIIFSSSPQKGMPWVLFEASYRGNILYTPAHPLLLFQGGSISYLP